MTIRHIVLWKLASEDADERAAHAAGIAERLRSLVGVVPAIRRLAVEDNVAYPEVNADVALIMEVDDLEALEAYQTHPAHQEAAGYIRSVVAARMGIDFTES